MVLGLRIDPSIVPSPLIGKPAPLISLPRLDMPDKSFSSVDLRGQIWLLNVWASWCVSCVAEHSLLMKFLRDDVPIVGLNYKDMTGDALDWLAKYGDPYYTSLADADGSIGLDWGVYGVPETFLIDQQGIVQYKHIGPLSRADIDNTILPRVRELQGEKTQ